MTNKVQRIVTEYMYLLTVLADLAVICVYLLTVLADLAVICVYYIDSVGRSGSNVCVLF